MSDSRRTPIYWSAGFAIFLVAYVASPPLLAVVFRHGPPSPPFDRIIDITYKPLQKLYNNFPWYRQYVDVTCSILVP